MVGGHTQKWVAAGPWWAGRLGRADFVQPVVATFTGDRFMETLLALLAADDTARAAGLASASLGTDTPKLFQPAHGDYTLVLASLVCTLPGLPEHKIGRQDRVGFVLRQLDASDNESAWVPAAPTPDADGPPTGTWLPVGSSDALVAGEQILSLFPMPWRDGPKTRRAWGGLVPVSARESYEGAATRLIRTEGGDPQLWKLELETKFFAVVRALKVAITLDGATAREVTRFALHDLAILLEARLGTGWLDSRPTGASRGAWDLVEGTFVSDADGGSAATLRGAARAAREHGADLLATGGWLDAPPWTLSAWTLDLDDLQRRLEGALEAAGLATGDSASGRVKVSAEGHRYRVRCVYTRPPCGTQSTEIVSGPSVPFRMAAFLDGDAPQRETRITLPFDTSLAGLRKLKKSVGIMMSAQMRAKTEAANTRDVLDGEAIEVDPPGMAWITIWSIPILTICATILMMIIAGLLNMVFWWLPLLRITIPVEEEAS